jgi:hypothetical protein
MRIMALDHEHHALFVTVFVPLSAKAYARAASLAPDAARTLLSVMHSQQDISVMGIDKIALDVMHQTDISMEISLICFL